MLCVDVWQNRDARWMAVHVLRLKWESGRVTRVERWHSEVEDQAAPFREWRVFEHGLLMMAWRIREDSA
jgi:hypothetical protein